MRLRRIALVLAASLPAVPAVVAQTVPYEAPQRSSIANGLRGGDLPKGGVFQPRIETAAQYVSNINLAEESEDEVDTAGLELSPGFYASYSSSSVLAAIDYTLIGRAWEDSDYDDVSHRLSANGQWMAVPEWFALRGDASYADGIVDPRQGRNYGGLGIFGSSNLEEIATGSLNPVLQHTFGDLEFEAQYRYGRVWYLDEGEGGPTTAPDPDRDSTDQTANVTLGSGESNSKLSGTLYYNWEKSEYEESLVPYEFERAGVDLGLQLTRTLTLVGGGGLETDLNQRVASGGLDSEFWSAGLLWSPNDRTSVEGRYADRSFGDSYSFTASHKARLLELSASYSEQPTVETRELSLSDIFPGELPPGVDDVGLGIFNSLPYIARTGEAAVRAVGSRTSVELSGFWYERDYLASPESDEDGYGGSFNATRQLASNLSADFDVLYRKYQYAPELGVLTASDDTDTEVTLRFNRTSGEKLTISAETGYLMRTGDQDYDGWWVAMRARWTP